MALYGYLVGFDACYLCFAAQLDTKRSVHDAHWSKLRIVLFFDIAGLANDRIASLFADTHKTILLRRDVVKRI